MRVLILALVVVTVGCGHEKDRGEPAKAPTTPAPYSMTVADAASVPACTKDNDRQLVYVEVDSKFQSCSGGAWVDVAMNSEHVTSQIVCTGDLAAADAPSLTLPPGGLHFRLVVSGTSAGDYFVSASVSDGARQSSASDVAPKGSESPELGKISVVDDRKGNANGGAWNLNQAQDKLRIEYADSDVSPAPAWLKGLCIKQTY